MLVAWVGLLAWSLRKIPTLATLGRWVPLGTWVLPVGGGLATIAGGSLLLHAHRLFIWP